MKQLHISARPTWLSQGSLRLLWDCPVRSQVTAAAAAGLGQAGGSCRAQACTEGSARQGPAGSAPARAARLPRAFVCERPGDRGPGAAPPRQTRHASTGEFPASSGPQPAAASSAVASAAPPAQLVRASERDLGPRRGGDGTDVAHAWWRPQARGPRRRRRRRGRRRAGPPGPGSWRRRRRRRGLARPCGRRPAAAGGALRRPGGEPPGGPPRAGRAGPAERAAAGGERPAAAGEPAAQARKPQPLPSGLAAPRRGRRRSARGGGESHAGPRGGRHEPDGERRQPRSGAGQPPGAEGPPREAGGHVPPRAAAAAPRAADAAPARRPGGGVSARARARPSSPGPGARGTRAVAGGRSREGRGPTRPLLLGSRPRPPPYATPRGPGSGTSGSCAEALRIGPQEAEEHVGLGSPLECGAPASCTSGFLHGERPSDWEARSGIWQHPLMPERLWVCEDLL